MTAIWICITILFLSVIIMGFLWYNLREEVTENKYLIVETDSKGNKTLKNHKGETILEL